MNTYLILPGCDDINRGDQALIWGTKELAEAAGYTGQYYMLAEADKSRQSLSHGILNMAYLLRHPSTFFRHSEDNLRYSKLLVMKWAIASVLCLLKCLPLLNGVTRKVAVLFCTKEERETLRIFSSAKAAFVKGGGFLHAANSLTETYKIFYFLYHIILAQSFGVPVYMLPNSFGPLDAPLSKWMVKRVLGRCKVVMARESISKAYLENVCHLNVELYSDLGFHLNREANFDAVDVLAKKGIRLLPGKSVAITMRPYRFPGYPNGMELYEKYKNSMSQFVVWLCRQGYYPVLVEHVYSDLVHEQDIACIKDVCTCIPQECRYGVFSDLTLTCREMKSIYSVFDYTVGTRFHSVIFSIAENVPSLAITYGGNKGTGIMKDIGLSQYVCPIEHVTTEQLTRLFSSLAEDEAVHTILNANAQKVLKERGRIVQQIKGA